MAYSQTRAFVWDEGFHLLAARLIREGKRPYLDFCFPQTPLNAYVNAAWMSLFGEGWRSAHVLATIFLALGIFLAADFVFRRFPVPAWKLPAAMFTAVLTVSVFDVVAFGTVAQAYAICLALIVVAFRLTCVAMRKGSIAVIFSAGLCAGAAAACSMLTAAAVVAILAWCVVENRTARWRTAATFLAGAVIPWTPVLWLFREGPRQVWFNVVQYQALYRRVNWGDVTPHDAEVFLGVTESPAALLLILLGAAGVYFVARRGDRLVRSEYFLCAAIALATSAELLTARPTFDRYFLLTVPFFAIPAAEGLYIAGSRLYRGDRPWRIAGAAAALAVLGLTNQLFGDRDAIKWGQMQKVAVQVEKVTPPGATLFADELTYFLTRRPPPEGMEFSYGHKLELPAAQAQSLHLLPESKLDQMVRAKRFATFESCDEDDMDRVKADSLYADHADFDTCKVYWNLK